MYDINTMFNDLQNLKPNKINIRKTLKTGIKPCKVSCFKVKEHARESVKFWNNINTMFNPAPFFATLKVNPKNKVKPFVVYYYEYPIK